MYKRMRYKLSTLEHPSKWLIVEFIKAVNDTNKIFIIREMNGWTLDEFRTTNDHITMSCVEVELDKTPYTSETLPTSDI